jgi:hypothetical protein
VAVATDPIDTGYIWVLDHQDGPVCHFDDQARLAWDAALTALCDTVSVLWKSPEVLRGRLPRAHPIGEWTSAKGPVRKVHTMNGGSFGLSFLVSQVSELTDAMPRADTIASVGVEPDGGIAVVDLDGLRVKIETVVDKTPSIRRFLVHHEQQADAQKSAGDRLEVIGVHSLRDGLDHALEQPLTKWLADLGSDRTRRREVVTGLFSAATGSIATPAPRTWRPFIEAAIVARRWPGLDPSDEYRLDYARAFAERHEVNNVSSPPPWPIPDGLSIPPEQEAAILANLMQQSYDCGVPPAEELLASFETRMPMPESVRHCFSHQLRSSGAYWRLQAKEGRLDDACVAQTDLASEWIERGDADEATRPLSEAYRLTGFLRNADALRKLETLRAASRVLMGSPYVSLHRGRALLALGESPAISMLARLLDSGSAPAHVRYSAARLLAGAGVRVDRVHEEMARVADVTSDANPGDRNAALVFLALEELDAALASTERRDSEVALALSHLEQLEPSLVAALVRLADARGLSPGPTVAAGFPY